MLEFSNSIPFAKKNLYAWRIENTLALVGRTILQDKTTHIFDSINVFYLNRSANNVGLKSCVHN